MQADTDRIDLFLCHTGANKDWVRDLATRLESEAVDGRPLGVFFDEWDIAPGENILSRIEDGLDRADFVAVALSPALTQAAWPTLEWQSQVYDDPTGKQGRIIPLVVEKFDPETLQPLDIPFALRLLRYLDFSDPKRFESNYQLLLARLRGQRAGRGRPDGLVDRIASVNPGAGPEVASLVEEVVLGNLFPVSLPTRLYSDFAKTTSYSEIRQSITGNFRTPFVLNGGRLYSFVSPDREPFRSVVAGSGKREERTADVLRDPERRRHVTWLCNDALRERCYELRLRTPPGAREPYYPVVAPGQSRTFSWGKGAPLTIAKVTEGEKPLGVHHAASMRFIIVDDEMHLLVEPKYFFTTDGYNPVPGRQAGRYSVQWGNREGNRVVLRRLLMWPRLLAGGPGDVLLRTGGSEQIKVAAAPRFGRTNQGVLGDDKDVQSLLQGTDAGEVLEGEDDLDAVAADHRRGTLAADDEEDSSDLTLEDDADESVQEFPF